MRRLMLLLFGLAMVGGTVLTFVIENEPNFPRPALARIIFWHLPCALGSTLFFLMAAYFSLRFAIAKEQKWDVLAAASIEICFVFGLLTLATGMVFSEVQWGAYWSWDPRQTSFLLVMLMVSATFALRAAFADEARRASASAGYVLSSLLPVLFLIFAYPRIVTTLHPDVIRGGGFIGSYRVGFLTMLALIFIAGFWVYRMRVRLGMLESKLEEIHAGLADGGDSAPTGVVRPLSLSDAD